MKFFLAVFRLAGLLNEHGEPSAHKLAAFSGIIMLGYAHFKYVGNDNVVTITIIDWLAILLFLGRIKFADVIKLKNGEGKPTESDKQISIETT